MKVICFLMMLLIAMTASSTEYLVKQGSLTITWDDLDGFAYTIPKDKRDGFFASIVRTNDTLTKLLNMKQIVRYANKKNLLDYDAVIKAVNERLMKEEMLVKPSFSVVIDKSRDLKKDYYTLVESYKQFQLYFKKNLDSSNLEELAEEKYLVNKEDYNIKESRDLDYIAIIYNKFNFVSQLSLAKEIQNKLQESTFDQVSKEYKNQNPDIEVVQGINNYTFTNKYKEFSEHVFTSTEVGVMDTIANIDPRLMIIVINKVINAGYKTFDEVKVEIIENLLNDKFQRDFQSLLTRLTIDKVIINEEQVNEIKKRY